jgi:hypothetical protein
MRPARSPFPEKSNPSQVHLTWSVQGDPAGACHRARFQSVVFLHSAESDGIGFTQARLIVVEPSAPSFGVGGRRFDSFSAFG